MAGSLPHGRPRSRAEVTQGPHRPADRIDNDPQRMKAFILDNTSLSAPPHVPEISLHLADEAHELWQRTEEQLQEIGLPPPFWAFAWAGGQGLARFILDRPEWVRGRRVFDFASGSGLVAIAARLAGAGEVTAADTDSFCRTALSLNCERNSVDVTFRGGDQIGTVPDCDILLAGDVFYDRPLAARLVPWFQAVARNGMTVLVGDPGRSYLPAEQLTALASYRVPVTRQLEDSEIKHTTVWRFG